jgi:hypothetical protein
MNRTGRGENSSKKMPGPLFKGSFVDAFLLRMKKKRETEVSKFTMWFNHPQIVNLRLDLNIFTI